jgi:hypothetical protein
VRTGELTCLMEQNRVADLSNPAFGLWTTVLVDHQRSRWKGRKGRLKPRLSRYLMEQGYHLAGEPFEQMGLAAHVLASAGPLLQPGRALPARFGPTIVMVLSV